MKRFFGLLALTLPLSVFSAELIIPAGEEFVIDADRSDMKVSLLKIGDGARIRVAEGVGHWHLQVARAEIGRNVVIDASGAAGRAGRDGGAPLNCTAVAGEEGGSGHDGANLVWQLGLAKLGSLRIVSSGGDGGAGGRGGAGANKSDNCPEPSSGGDGGSGGHGGNGGDISIAYRLLDDGLTAAKVLDGINLANAGGRGGAMGQGGPGGEGEGGRFITRRSLTGNRQWVAGEGRADDGRKGSKGRPGEAGQSHLQLLSSSVAPSEKGSDIDALRLELEALQRRVERLEQNRN
ncbi:hypothetical protein HCU74_13560 [Spongiibacter sp. KMU-166]|uniref:Collagen triple helix repeat (20 copies) n=1 Tax=Spongiibacter thalassae TaxID=2721624 RepID=A0ABX1GGV8_9GAMM|nr:hypothetical protein [Spongiibacter thalassae]NKI18439.1 hypothetical protein [Spongiibacter thalassae]